jgi:hypothetical protein
MQSSDRKASHTVTDFNFSEGDKVEIKNDQASDVLEFIDNGGNAEMYLNDQLAAIFQGATASDVEDSVINYAGDFAV